MTIWWKSVAGTRENTYVMLKGQEGYCTWSVVGSCKKGRLWGEGVRGQVLGALLTAKGSQ